MNAVNTARAANTSTYPTAEIVVGRRINNSAPSMYFDGFVIELLTEGYHKGYLRLGSLNGDERVVPASILRSLPWRVMDDACTSDEVAFILAAVAAKKSAAVRARAAKEAREAAEQAELIKANPDLVVGRYRDSAVVNMRTLLKKAFAVSHKGVRFSVTQPRGSGVNSVDVRWTGGPSEDEVRAIVGKFQSSRFNSMTDSHESTRSVWTDTFGGCSGIFYTRK